MPPSPPTTTYIPSLLIPVSFFKFQFDHSYWSHDGYTEGDDGLLLSQTPKFATQKDVFQDVSCSLFNSVSSTMLFLDLYFFYFLSLFKVNSSTMVRYSRGGSMLPAVYADVHFTNDVVACVRWASSCLRMRTQALTPPSLYVVVELELSSSTRAMITGLLTQYAFQRCWCAGMVTKVRTTYCSPCVGS